MSDTPVAPEGCLVPPWDNGHRTYKCFHEERGLMYYSLGRWFNDHSYGNPADWQHIGMFLSKEVRRLKAENLLMEQRIAELGQQRAVPSFDLQEKNGRPVDLRGRYRNSREHDEGYY